VFRPIGDFEILRALRFVAEDQLLGDQLVQPAVDQCWRVIVVGIQLPYEDVFTGSAPAGIIDEGPELNEQQARVTREAAD
jgi:hypothetical protein